MKARALTGGVDLVWLLFLYKDELSGNEVCASLCVRK